MSTYIQKHLLAVFIGFFFFVPYVYANVEITELMYDVTGSDTDHEWLEIHNTGTDPVDMSTWYTYDTSHHQLHPATTSSLGADVYAVVVGDIDKFKSDWPNYSGLIFQSNFASLGNEGDTIKLKDNNDKDGAIADSVTYTSSMGGSENGDSLQKIGGVFVGRNPTPGSANVQTISSSGSTSGSTPASTVVEKAKPKTKEPDIPKITTDIIVDPVVFTGVAFHVRDKTTGLTKEPRLIGKYVWNFGDGVCITLDHSTSYEHRYMYPGEYVVVLSYYDSFADKNPASVDRLTITVVPLPLAVSAVGTESDPYVELENTSKYEMPLSDWSLRAGDKHFLIPEGTILLPNKKIKFSPQVTGFTYDDVKGFTLANLAKGTAGGSVPLRVPSSSSVSSARTKASSHTATEVIDLNSLGASAATAPSSESPYVWFGLGGLIIVGGAAVYLMRKKDLAPDSLDEPVRADDMKIIE